MKRLDHAVIAIVVFLAFFADLRVIAAVMTVVLLAWAVWRPADRFGASIGVLAFGASTAAFAVDNEIAGWTIALAVAVAAGVSAVGPTVRGRPVAGRRGGGSSSRAG